MFSRRPYVLCHSWFSENDDKRQSLEYFSSSMEVYVKALTEMQDTLQLVAMPFRKREVLPFQCRKAMMALVDLTKRIDELCDLFSEIALLPLAMIALRYRFLDELYYIEEQACKLSNLIDSYYERGITSTQQRRQQENAISELFTTLLQHIIDIPSKIGFMFDEAKFQEIRIASSS